MSNNQIQGNSPEEIRKKYIEKRRRQQVANQTLNLNTIMQRSMKSDPAIMNVIEQVASTSGMPGLLKLQQMTAAYISIVNNGGQM